MDKPNDAKFLAGPQRVIIFAPFCDIFISQKCVPHIFKFLSNINNPEMCVLINLSQEGWKCQHVSIITSVEIKCDIQMEMLMVMHQITSKKVFNCLIAVHAVLSNQENDIS